MTSEARTWLDSVCAIAFSTLSPAAWPNASLIGLKRSTSSTSSAPLAE